MAGARPSGEEIMAELGFLDGSSWGDEGLSRNERSLNKLGPRRIPQTLKWRW